MAYNKKILTNSELIELAVGSVDHEENDGALHLYRCLREQIEAYWKLSDNLGEWSGRTNGLRLDFVTDSPFFSFKVVVGKKYELFINGKKEDHITIPAGEVFYKELEQNYSYLSEPRGGRDFRRHSCRGRKLYTLYAHLRKEDTLYR